MWVKLCGNTTLEDAQMCAAAGADALGFVFAPDSRRYITPHAAAPICRAIAKQFAHVELVGVFTHGDARSIAAIVRQAGLTGAQLQSARCIAEGAALQEASGGITLTAAFPWAGDQALAQMLAHNSEDYVFDSFLVDASGAHDTGGTGNTFNWRDAAPSFASAHAAGEALIAAGGLTPENVTEAVTILQPWGVDVATGVESAPGVKDRAKVRAFLAAARVTR